MTCDVDPVKKDLAFGGRVKLGDEIEASAFAGAIGPDDGVNGVAMNLQVHIVDRNKPQEFLGESARLNDQIVCLRHKCEL